MKASRRRYLKKIATLEAILKSLQEGKCVNENQFTDLESISVNSKELYNRQLQSKGKLTKIKYSPALRSFALTHIFTHQKLKITYEEVLIHVCHTPGPLVSGTRVLMARLDSQRKHFVR